jgi:hypothetical protein
MTQSRRHVLSRPTLMNIVLRSVAAAFDRVVGHSETGIVDKKWLSGKYLLGACRARLSGLEPPIQDHQSIRTIDPPCPRVRSRVFPPFLYPWIERISSPERDSADGAGDILLSPAKHHVPLNFTQTLSIQETDTPPRHKLCRQADLEVLGKIRNRAVRPHGGRF